MNTEELIKIEDDYFINTFTRQPIVLDHGKVLKYGISMEMNILTCLQELPSTV